MRWLGPVALVACGHSSPTGAPVDGMVVNDGDMLDTRLVDDGAGPPNVWHPHPGTSWQWQLSGTVDTSIDVKMYDIDLFDTPQATIDNLHAAGRKVICYLSAGTYEPGRPDSSQFPASVRGNELPDWPGEYWLDTRSTVVRNIMKARMDLAMTKHFDGYTNNPGFPLTAATQLDYNRFLATEAHTRLLSVGLKNDTDQIIDLEPMFDWALNEQCWEYTECDKYNPFLGMNKAVFNTEYGAASLATSVCPKANAANLDTLIKNLDLDAWRVACR